MWNWMSDPQVPHWARFFDPHGYQTFLNTVANDLGRRGDMVEIDDGVARVTIADDRHQFGLQNLAQVCNQSESDAWADMIRQHFDNVIRSTAATDLERLGNDFSSVESLIKVRLYPREAVVDSSGSGPIHRRVGEQLVAALVYDLPEAVATVPAEAPSSWPIDIDAAFDLGLANVLEQDEVECERVRLDHGGEFWAMVGDSFFVTSRLLVLEQYLEPRTAFGALVSVPNRHTLLFTPIVDMSVLPSLNALLVVSERRFMEGPGSLSPLLYWWRDGHLLALPADIDDGQVRFYPPEDFVKGCLEPLGRRSGNLGPN
jgi:hypothetical protein